MRIAPALAILAAVSLCGCGGGPPEPVIHPVKGRVTFKGPSLAGGMVALRDSRQGIVNGIIQADGSFVIETVIADKRKPGAEAGTYDVEVVSPQTENQTSIPIVVRTKKVTVEAKENDLTIVVDPAGR